MSEQDDSKATGGTPSESGSSLFSSVSFLQRALWRSGAQDGPPGTSGTSAAKHLEGDDGESVADHGVESESTCRVDEDGRNDLGLDAPAAASKGPEEGDDRKEQPQVLMHETTSDDYASESGTPEEKELVLDGIDVDNDSFPNGGVAISSAVAVGPDLAIEGPEEGENNGKEQPQELLGATTSDDVASESGIFEENELVSDGVGVDGDSSPSGDVATSNAEGAGTFKPTEVKDCGVTETSEHLLAAHQERSPVLTQETAPDLTKDEDESTKGSTDQEEEQVQVGKGSFCVMDDRKVSGYTSFAITEANTSFGSGSGGSTDVTNADSTTTDAPLRVKKPWFKVAICILVTVAFVIILAISVSSASKNRGTGLLDLAEKQQEEEEQAASPTLMPTYMPSHKSPLKDAIDDVSASVDTALPTKLPSGQVPSPPRDEPTKAPTSEPTKALREEPMRAPNAQLSNLPVLLSNGTIAEASIAPTTSPSKSPTKDPAVTSLPGVTYMPGKLDTQKHGILLSSGLNVKIVAQSGKVVKFTDGSGQSSPKAFHANPDFGATFPDVGSNKGGWVYVSNSEVDGGKGGVGAIKFNKGGKVINYNMLLRKTSMNCGGGKTPWGTWISCEEVTSKGQIWEVDPYGRTAPTQTVLGGKTGGRFESFTYDIRRKRSPKFFYTEDRPNGALRRFTPSIINWNNPSEMLHREGTIEYLILKPTKGDNSTGTFSWSKNIEEGRRTASRYFPGSEGIDASDGYLYFVSKKESAMFILDLDGGTFERKSTVHGVFDGSPDQLQRLVGEEEILYFTEEGGNDAGVHARDSAGRFFTILESPLYKEETTGLAFSPDAKHMYVAYQKNGILLDVWRKDGLPFSGKTLNVKYHNTQVR